MVAGSVVRALAAMLLAGMMSKGACFCPDTGAVAHAPRAQTRAPG